MEESLNYATVVFKNGDSPQKGNNEDSTIYSTVKSKVPAATGTKNDEDSTIYSTVKCKVPAATGTIKAAGGGAAAAHSRHFVLMLVCLGILCVLLMACIGVIIYIFGVMKAQEAVAENVIHREKENIVHLKEENQRLMIEKEILANETQKIPQLMMEKEILANETQKIPQLMMEKEILANKTKVLTRDRDDLNRTLGVIMTFQNFPVRSFCPQKMCQPCKRSWIPFQDHCYLFYERPPRWKTWRQARTICQNSNADLVVVDSLQEQEFINNHTKYYFDNNHGYWMGLSQNEDKWIWIDGRSETDGYWNQKKVRPGTYAMTFPTHDATASWGKARQIMENKFICEHEALIRTPVS